jgi:hypothetical protein
MLPVLCVELDPYTLLITVDDDVVYGPHLLETFLKHSTQCPDWALHMACENFSSMVDSCSGPTELRARLACVCLVWAPGATVFGGGSSMPTAWRTWRGPPRAALSMTTCGSLATCGRGASPSTRSSAETHAASETTGAKENRSTPTPELQFLTTKVLNPYSGAETAQSFLVRVLVRIQYWSTV